MEKKKLIQCPHCQKSQFYRTDGEFMTHMNSCPSRYSDPQKRFKASLALKKKKNK